MKWFMILVMVLLCACNAGNGGPPPEPATALEQLLEAGAPELAMEQEEILVEYDGNWPRLPLVESAWCGMSVIYWMHGVESELDKDALVLDQDNDQWHLWLFSYSKDLGNAPSPDIDSPDTWQVTHCKIGKLHILPKLYPGIPFQIYIIRDRFRQHYDAECQAESGTRKTDWYPAMLELRGLQGRVTLSIGSPDDVVFGYQDRDEGAVFGAWETMKTCPWLDSPRPGDLVDEEDIERAKKWVWSPLGQDAPLGETAEQVNARAREYWENN